MRRAGGKIPRLTGTNLDWVFKREQCFRGRGRKNVGRSWGSGVVPPWLSRDAAILGASLFAWECWLSERIAGFPPVGGRCPLVFTQNSVSGQGCLWQSYFAHHLALGDAVCPPRQAPCPTHLRPHPYFPSEVASPWAAAAARYAWAALPTKARGWQLAPNTSGIAQTLEGYLVKV